MKTTESSIIKRTRDGFSAVLFTVLLLILPVWQIVAILAGLSLGALAWLYRAEEHFRGARRIAVKS